MRLTIFPAITTLAAGMASAALMDPGDWDAAKSGLLTALSVMAAAALVRLARGLPFTNPDHFDISEVEQVTAAVKQLARALRAFLFVIFSAMVLLVFVKALADTAVRLFAPPTARAIDISLSFAVGAALAYVLTRIWQIVGSDLGLLDKQAKFMVRAVNRKARQRLEADEANIKPFDTPEGYGRQIQ